MAVLRIEQNVGKALCVIHGVTQRLDIMVLKGSDSYDEGPFFSASTCSVAGCVIAGTGEGTRSRSGEDERIELVCAGVGGEHLCLAHCEVGLGNVTELSLHQGTVVPGVTQF